MSKRVRQRWDHKGMPLRAVANRHRGTYVPTVIRKVDPVESNSNPVRSNAEDRIDEFRRSVLSDGRLVTYSNSTARISTFPAGSIPGPCPPHDAPDLRSPEDRMADVAENVQRSLGQMFGKARAFRQDQDAYFD